MIVSMDFLLPITIVNMPFKKRNNDPLAGLLFYLSGSHSTRSDRDHPAIRKVRGTHSRPGSACRIYCHRISTTLAVDGAAWRAEVDRVSGHSIFAV